MSDPPGAGGRRRTGAETLIVAVALAAAAAMVVVFAPLQRSTSMRTGTNGVTVTSTSSQSLLDTEGAGIAAVAAIPVVLCLLPLFGLVLRSDRVNRVVRIAAAVLLALFVFLTGFSIGLLYVPALVALIVATAR